MTFRFGEYKTRVHISNGLPKIGSPNSLFVADENTLPFAEKIRFSDSNTDNAPICVLKSGEENKNWEAIERILSAAKNAGLSRDSVIIGVGGGVIGDLTAFAASIYMRGCKLTLVSTTLLAMVDASVGGKTGFDLIGIKNLIGSFYPAQDVYIPLSALETLPEKEYKSGMAELIKTAILSGCENELSAKAISTQDVAKAIQYKAGIVSRDFKETKNMRVLLNLGHTFGHAFETAAGLGNVTHGEAVAWGIYQACGFGTALGITPVKRAQKIKNILSDFGYDISSPHPLAKTPAFLSAIKNDKKKRNNLPAFIVPNKTSAQIVYLNEMQTQMLDNILNEGFTL